MGLVTINGIEYNKFIGGDKIRYSMRSKEFRIEEKIEKMGNKSYSYECTIYKIEEGKGRTERWYGSHYASTSYDTYAINMARYEVVKEAKISLQDFSFALGVIADPYPSDSLQTYLKVIEDIYSTHDNPIDHYGCTILSSQIIRVTQQPNGKCSEKILSYRSESLSNGQKKREIEEYNEKINNSLKLLRFAGIIQAGISLDEFKNAIHERVSLQNPGDSWYFKYAGEIYEDFKDVELINHINTASSTKPATPKAVTTKVAPVAQVILTVPTVKVQATIAVPVTPVIQSATTLVNSNNSNVIPPKVTSSTEDVTILGLVKDCFKDLVVENKGLLVLILILIGSLSYCSGYVLLDKHLNNSPTAPRATPQKSN